MQRLLGIIMLVIGLAGIVLSIAGAIVGRELIADIGQSLDDNLRLTLESLQTVNESLILTKTTVGQIGDALETMEVTADNVAVSLDESRPLLQQTSQVVGGDVADGIESFQAGIPALVEVADTIDTTLITLSRFRIDRQILGIPLRYDLGINYDPEIPFARTIEDIGASMEGLPEELRTLQLYLEVTDENVMEIGGNIATIADDLAAVNESVDELEPLLDEFVTTITEFSDNTRQTRVVMQEQLDTFQLVWTVVMVWLALTQAAPIYLGAELLLKRRVVRVEA